jgi:predicted DNA-binding transcriptional regulator AlpA
MDQRSILNSWKEIALYMGRAVRTVQRWEEQCQLPVHRPRGKKRSSVFALAAEIDRWLEACPVGGIGKSASNHIGSNGHSNGTGTRQNR